jgi:hypothetical protein
MTTVKDRLAARAGPIIDVRFAPNIGRGHRRPLKAIRRRKVCDLEVGNRGGLY